MSASCQLLLGGLCPRLPPSIAVPRGRQPSWALSSRTWNSAQPGAPEPHTSGPHLDHRPSLQADGPGGLGGGGVEGETVRQS